MKSREERVRQGKKLVWWWIGVGTASLVLWATVGASMDGQTFTGLLQVIVLSITAYIVWKYTKETEGLRLEAQKQVGAAHKQIEVAQQQVAETQRQIEVQQRPFVILTPEVRQGDLKGLKVQNIGNSAAINIRMVIDGELITLPKLSPGESVAGPMIPKEQDDTTQAIHATQERWCEENPL